MEKEQRFDKIPFRAKIVSKEQALKLSAGLNIITEEELKFRTE